MKHGVDISHWQANVDLDTARPSLDFIALKATQGVDFLDPVFPARWRKARDLGLPRVAYHYAELGSPVNLQAEWFVSRVRAAGLEGVWACMLDFEDPTVSIGMGARSFSTINGLQLDRDERFRLGIGIRSEIGTRAIQITSSEMWTWAATWINTVRGLLNRPVAFYSYPNYVVNVMEDPAKMPGGPTTVDWIARYGAVSGPWEGLTQARMYPRYPSIWQCSNGTAGCVTDVPGIGKVDYNHMNDAGNARLFDEQVTGYNVDEVVKSIQAAPDDETAIEIERKFVEDTADS